MARHLSVAINYSSFHLHRFRLNKLKANVPRDTTAALRYARVSAEAFPTAGRIQQTRFHAMPQSILFMYAMSNDIGRCEHIQCSKIACKWHSKTFLLHSDERLRMIFVYAMLKRHNRNRKLCSHIFPKMKAIFVYLKYRSPHLFSPFNFQFMFGDWRVNKNRRFRRSPKSTNHSNERKLLRAAR